MSESEKLLNSDQSNSENASTSSDLKSIIMASITSKTLDDDLKVVSPILDSFKKREMKTEEILEKMNQLLPLINQLADDVWKDDRLKLVIHCIFNNNEDVLNLVIDILLKLPTHVASKYVICNHIIMYLRNLLKMNKGYQFSVKIMKLLAKCNDSPTMFLKYHSYGLTDIFIKFIEEQLVLINPPSKLDIDSERISVILNLTNVLNVMFTSKNRRKEMVDKGLVNLCSNLLITFVEGQSSEDLKRKLFLLKNVRCILKKANDSDCVIVGVSNTEICDALMEYMNTNVAFVSDCMMFLCKLLNQRNMTYFKTLVEFIKEQMTTLLTDQQVIHKSTEIAINALEILSSDLGLMDILGESDCYDYLVEITLNRRNFPQVKKSLNIIHRLVLYHENISHVRKVHLLILMLELTEMWFNIYKYQKGSHNCFHKLSLYRFLKLSSLKTYYLSFEDYNPTKFSKSILIKILEILHVLIIKKNTIINENRLIVTLLNFVDLQKSENTSSQLYTMCMTINNTIVEFQTYLFNSYLEILSMCNLYTSNRTFCHHCTQLYSLTDMLLNTYQNFFKERENYDYFINYVGNNIHNKLTVSFYLLESKEQCMEYFALVPYDQLESKLSSVEARDKLSSMLSAITFLSTRLCNHSAEKWTNSLLPIKAKKEHENPADFMAPIYASNEGCLITLNFPIEKQFLKVPKKFLMENLLFFNAMYKGSYLESNSDTFNVTKYKYKSMLFLMRFIYTFVDNDNTHNANEFFELGVPDKISYEILLMADFYGNQCVSDSLMKFIPSKFCANNYITYYKSIIESGTNLLLNDIMCFFLHTGLTIYEKMQIFYFFESSKDRGIFVKYLTDYLWKLIHDQKEEK